MKYPEKISEVVWHEFGHILISIISSRKILHFTIERKSTYFEKERHDSFAGGINLEPINHFNNLNSLTFSILNYYSGSISQSIYNKNQSAYNLFIRGKNVSESDYSKYLSLIEKIEIENNINISNICIKYFEKFEKILETKPVMLKCFEKNCNLILEKYYSSNNPVSYRLEDVFLRNIISDFSNTILSTNIDNELNNLVSEMSTEIKKLE